MKRLPHFLCFVLLTLITGTAHAYTLEGCSISCHRPLRNLNLTHKPVVQKKCLECHKQVGNHPLGGKESMALVEKVPNLCFRCHKPFPQKKTVHPPVKNGKCTACHNPHGAPGRYLIDADNGQTKFCTGCHDAKLFSQKFVHPPVAEGKCTACHDPHQSDAKSLLRDGVPKLCLGCHAEVMKKLGNAPVAHPPVKEGRCTACHDPHSSPARYLLKGPPGQFCITCHTEIGKNVASSKARHSPLDRPESCLACHSGHTAQVKSLLPAGGKDFCLRCHVKIASVLEGKKSVHGPISEGKCTPCHDPHGTPYMKLLKGKYPEALYVPFEKGKDTYDFCLKCHEKFLISFPETTFYTKFRNGKENLHFFHVTNKKKGRTCRLCHEPHASNGDHLLRVNGAEFGEWNIPLRFVPNPTGGTCSPGCHGTYSYDRNAKDKK
ncbi:MAG TPA: cytochrome c3 family protein [Geobacteraceae bacterium]|nr:cytochrome c3 family protein [Geobacteraceae bacterium]